MAQGSMYTSIDLADHFQVGIIGSGQLFRKRGSLRAFVEIHECRTEPTEAIARADTMYLAEYFKKPNGECKGDLFWAGADVPMPEEGFIRAPSIVCVDEVVATIFYVVMSCSTGKSWL
jgi:hypothetical protein